MTDDAKIIGGFRVLKDLRAGSGSQGTVYQAVCEKPCFSTLAVGDVVALKVMAVQDDDGDAYARLVKRTAELVTLNHPGVVRYHGCFREKGPFNDVHVLVLEFVDGKSLKAMLEDSPHGLGTEETMRIASGLVAALAYTSTNGIVHRDIKPGNVIIQPNGMPKLIDFEVARRADGTLTTGSSNMIGTFDYMAPDFTSADFRGDVTSDVFSVGVCLHEMLTGRTPYRSHSGTSSQANVAFLQRWISAGSTPNPLRISSRIGKLLGGMRELLERTLEPDRDRRIRDFVDFGNALRKVHYRELEFHGHVWRLLNYVGRGGFGEVFEAVNRQTGEHVAIKHLLQGAEIDRFRREANVMRKVSSDCFTRFVDWFTVKGGSAFLVMDYLDGMPGLSLKNLLKANGGRPLARGDVLTAFVRYAHGLADLHSHHIVHRDIKPDNLYFPISNPGKAVIMDLGIARDVSGTATVGRMPGTIDYMPPECVTGKNRGGPEADVWALGLCLYEALTGKTAYPRLPDGVAAFEESLKRIKNRVRPDFSGVDDMPELLDLLREMCALKPEKRLRDMRLVERRLRIANGESSRTLPIPPGEFVWKGECVDADFSETADAESESGATMDTICVKEDKFAQFRNDYENKSRASKRRWLRSIVFLVLIAVLGVGGVCAWRLAEKRRLAVLREAEQRALILAEETRMKEEAERREREEAERQAEAERQRKEKERLEIEEKRKREEAERQAEAERQRKEKERLEIEEKRKREEAERLAEAERKRKEDQQRKIEEKRKQDEAEKAEAERKAKEKAEKAKRDEEVKAAVRIAEAKKREQAEKTARDRVERERKEANEKASRARQSKIDALDAAFNEYDRRYRAKLDEALKPGSRIDPVQLQQEWLIKKQAYKQARKNLEDGQ